MSGVRSLWSFLCRPSSVICPALASVRPPAFSGHFRAAFIDINSAMPYHYNTR